MWILLQTSLDCDKMLKFKTKEKQICVARELDHRESSDEKDRDNLQMYEPKFHEEVELSESFVEEEALEELKQKIERKTELRHIERDPLMMIVNDDGTDYFNVSLENNAVEANAKKHDITNEIAFGATLLRNGIMSLNDELKFATRYDKITINNHASDSLLDDENESMIDNETLTSYSQNLEENLLEDDLVTENNILDEDLRPPVPCVPVEKVRKKILKPPRPLKPVKDPLELTHYDSDCDYDFVNNTCPCFYKTSTPVRVEFDPYEEIFPIKRDEPLIKKVFKLQTTEDNLQELRDSDERLADCLNDGNEALTVSLYSQHGGSCSPRVKQTMKKIGKHSKRGALSVFTTVLSNIV